jgi:hypothetical protein
VLQKLQVDASSIPPMAVKVANGASLSCVSEARNFEWWCQGHTFQVNAKIIDIGAYDLVLGMDWLEEFSPLVCDWSNKWMELQHHNVTIRLQGIIPSQDQELKEVPME